MSDDRGPDAHIKEGLAAAGLAAIAVACCAALPLLAAFAGGIAIGALLRVGAGVLAVVVLAAVVVLRRRSPRGPTR